MTLIEILLIVVVFQLGGILYRIGVIMEIMKLRNGWRNIVGKRDY